ncbi:MAG: FAD-binding oxidoreductase [Desulfobacteraceae bacterium]|nr:FAD-binding oxidoreductase [Desulfobacteraceae bacterium]
MNTEPTSTLQGLWAKTAQGSSDFYEFKGDRFSDVAVIGGGYTGLSAALHLAQKACTVTLLEANHIGFGGAGRNVGLVNAGLWLMPDDVVKNVGHEFGERLVTELGNSPDLVFSLIDEHDIQCEAVRKGTLHCAHSLSGFNALKQRKIQWQQRGAPVQLLDKADADPLIGSHEFHGALLDLRAGTIQPLSYALGLARAADNSGADLFVHSPVTGIKRKNGKYHITTSKGTLTAKAVILACQGYAQDGVKNNLKALVPFNYFQFSTKPLSEAELKTILPKKHGAWDTDTILSSFRLDKDGHLIVGSVGNIEGIAKKIHKAWALRSIKKVFPQIRTIEFEFGWYGTIAMTSGHIPGFQILGPDFISVTGYNGRGIGPGTYFGKAMAQYLLEHDKKLVPLPAQKLKPIFSRELRGLFYETGARMYHLIQRRI